MWRWALCALLLQGLSSGAAHAEVITLDNGAVLIAATPAPPPRSDAWQSVQLPDEWRRQRGAIDGTTLWYRFEFDWPARSTHGVDALYVPYLSNGGDLLLNAAQLAHLPSTNDAYVVRWEQPYLIYVPQGMLQPGRNTLFLRTVLREFGSAQQLPVLAIGAETQLRPTYERRLFLVHSVPLFTVVASTLIAILLLLIWWRRRQELLYALLGVGSLLWGVRTLTLLLEFLPVEVWPTWRIVYHGATGGFVVALALFVLRFSGLKLLRVERSLIAYWAAGLAVLLIDVGLEHPWISRYWTLGLLLVGCGTLGVTVYAACKHRTWQAVALCAVFALTCIAGFHDFLADLNVAALQRLAPGWLPQHIFLLHHAANLMLLVLTGILTTRFAQTLDAVEELNATLEQRVAEREQQLTENYRELARLSRERAVEEERERLIRDMHDGLGSQLFISLSRVQRAEISQREMLEILRASIAEMRLAMDAMAPRDDDFQAVLGNFRYRWQAELAAAGIDSTWRIDAVQLPAQHRLQVLRILQEALTNVLKHARASKVTVCARHETHGLTFEVADDGCGALDGRFGNGRGVGNMQRRAGSMGARLEIVGSSSGTRIALHVGGTLAQPVSGNAALSTS